MNSYIISHEGTRNAKQMLMTNPRKRVLGLPWLVAAEGLCLRCRTDLVFPCPPERPGKCAQSQLWHPVLCCGVTCSETRWDLPLGCWMVGGGRQLTPRGLVTADSTGSGLLTPNFSTCVLCLLIAGGKVGSPQMTSQRKDCIFWALLADRA